MKKPTILGISFSFIIIMVFGCAHKQGEPVERISRPLEYRGYTEPLYDSYERRSVYVTMEDGTRLATDIYIPTGGPDRESFPVIFQMLPYTRAFGFPDMKWYHKLIARSIVGSTSPVIDANALDHKVGLFLSHGYTLVVTDMRGCGASYGRALHPIPESVTDSRDMLNWIADQPWCDGNIGMFGGSYRGYIQLVSAGHDIKALKCVAPSVAPMGYADLMYPGGIFCQGMAKEWSRIVTYLNGNMRIPAPRYPLPMVMPAMPVVDEDGDGDLIDEIPVYGDDGTFLHGPPKYSDGQPRENIYYNAVMEHRANVNFDSFGGDLTFIDSPLPKPFPNISVGELLVYSRLPKIMKTGIPIYDMGGWHDGFVRTTTEAFCTLRNSNQSKMIINAGYHTGRGPYWKYFGVDQEEFKRLEGIEHLRYFDHYLKGVDNGIDREPPVTIFVQGEGWRQENEWPLARQVVTDFYLGENYGFGTEKPAAGSDDYLADLSHDSRYGKHLANRYLSAASFIPDKLPVRTEKDKSLLTYTSKPLADDMEVTGHPIADIWVSSTASYGDFFVYLEDVEPGGRVVLVTEGQLRAGFAALHDNDLMGNGGVDIEPELPWHGYRKADYVDGILADGAVVELRFDLMPTSWVFKKGHSLRVSIACADWPTFRLHPKLSPANDPADPGNIVPTITLHRGNEYPSRVELPVIPR